MSLVTKRVHIMGGLPREGKLENGTVYDSYELYVLESINPEVGFGQATVPLKFGKSANKHMFEGCKSPLLADIDLMTVTNGRGGSTDICTAVRLVKQ